MGLYDTIDRLVGGILPWGAPPAWRDEPSEVALTQTGTLADPRVQASGMRLPGKTVTLIGKMTASGFVPTGMKPGGVSLFRNDITAFKRVRRIVGRIAGKLGLRRRSAGRFGKR